MRQLEHIMAKDKVFMTLNEKIVKSLNEYNNHLFNKYTDRLKASNLSSIDEKLNDRYQAINKCYLKALLTWDDNFNDYHVDNQSIENALAICINNIPTWDERSFIQKLTDLTTIILKPLHHDFFSKEKRFEKELQKKLNNALSPEESTVPPDQFAPLPLFTFQEADENAEDSEPNSYKSGRN